MRTAIAIVGLAFPILLVFVQLGLHDAVLRTGEILYDVLEFDAALVSPHYLSVRKPDRVRRPHLVQALGISGVRDVTPLYIASLGWRNAETGARRDLLVVGYDPRRPPFRLAEVAMLTRGLERPDTVLFDRRARPEYGPRTPGTVGEAGGRRLTVAGEYTLGAGLLADGIVLTSDETFARLFPGRSIDDMTLGLVRLDPRGDPEGVLRALRARLPSDVRVLSRPALEEAERGYWGTNTSVGIIFGAGAAVEFAVLAAVMYQLLSTDITSRLREYATLKALGYADRTLAWMVVQQAFALIGAALAVGLVLATIVCAIIVATVHLPVAMTPGRGLGVAAIALALGVAIALTVLRRLRAADPADLF